MHPKPLTLPADLDRRLRGVAAERGESPRALLRTILRITLSTLAGQRPLPSWWLTVMHLADEDLARVGLDKILTEAPRWSAEPVGTPDLGALCLLRRDDGVWLTVEFVHHRRKLHLLGGLGDRYSERSLILDAKEAWIDLSAAAWRRMLTEADRLADELHGDQPAPA
jgi:hypothetical protein